MCPPGTHMERDIVDLICRGNTQSFRLRINCVLLELQVELQTRSVGTTVFEHQAERPQ